MNILLGEFVAIRKFSEFLYITNYLSLNYCKIRAIMLY